MESVPSEDSHSENNDDERVYFVPLRWWKEAKGSMPEGSEGKEGVLYSGVAGSSYAGPMKIINNIFNSDLVFGLRREEESSASVQNRENGEVGVSGRDFALVSGEMWLQALKWHNDSKNAKKDEKGCSSTEEDMADIYPLQLKLNVQKETKSLGVRISKKDNAPELFKRSCKLFGVDTEM
ncbi:hypothetical protein PIB30_077935, partial [Stylosanthes scabra]|nr:hypothetical protein [Stylosanthes scabra]